MRSLLIAAGVSCCHLVSGQDPQPLPVPSDFPFQIRLEETFLNGFPALQSYAFGVWNGHWILMGGRTDGLHKRQPFASFSAERRNTAIWLANPVTGRAESLSTAGMSAELAEQIRGTNMQFYQLDSLLVITGGYGYSEIARDHRTHAALTVVNLAALMRHYRRGESVAPAFEYLKHEQMAVAGGRLGYINGIFYLAGGQRFDGRYNPHGPNHGPGFRQQYTNAIRRFRLVKEASAYGVEMLEEWHDTALLHRRDYNLLPQILPEGRKVWMIYSGVFQPDRDLPFTTLVQFDENGHHLVPDFNQRLNHYHSANLPVHDAAGAASYAVFFGGIARHVVNEQGEISTDDNVPFVRQISVVGLRNGKFNEWYFEQRMPVLAGTSAEIIAAEEAPWRSDGLLDLDRCGPGEVLVGYLVGGIESSGSNVFFSPPNSSPSQASSHVWKVYLKKR
jgi:hypothetical protein